MTLLFVEYVTICAIFISSYIYIDNKFVLGFIFGVGVAYTIISALYRFLNYKISNLQKLVGESKEILNRAEKCLKEIETSELEEKE